MRARRRPRAVLVMWLFEVVVGVVLAAPMASYVRSVYASHPDGDAPLFADGGIDLLPFLLNAKGAAPVFVSHATLVLLLAYVAGLVPLALFLLSVAHTTADLRAPKARLLWPRVTSSFGPLLGLLVLATIAEIIAAAVAIFAGTKLASSLEPTLGDARADQLGAVLALILLVGTAALGVIHDLSRAAVVRFRQRTLGALRMGAKAFARSPARLLWSWAWRAGAALLPIAAVSAISTRLGGRSGVALAALFALHQAVILSRVAFRASWLARAMRAMDATFHVTSRRS